MKVIHNTSDKLKEQLAGSICDVLIAHQDSPILVLYSGGSWLDVMPALYSKIAAIDLELVIFAPVDERRDPIFSNSRAFAKLPVYDQFKERGSTFVDCGDLSLSLEVIADGYDQQIRWLIEDVREHSGVVISLLGMGEDGHTAGIFPYSENPDYFQEMFIETNQYVVGYDVGNKHAIAQRITLTLPALVESDFTFVYVVGSQKTGALRKATEPGELAETPARIWQKLKNVVIFTDCLLN